MSCNGCRVLRKGCNDACVLRPSLRWIDSPEAQGHATLFLARFFGRARLLSFLAAVPEPHRSALFQSLLFEACGRTVNPVHGAGGLLLAGNWHLCQEAVETVLRGGALHPLPWDEEPQPSVAHEAGVGLDAFPMGELFPKQQSRQWAPPERRKSNPTVEEHGGEVTVSGPVEPSTLELCLAVSEPRVRKRPGTPSEESVTTSVDSGIQSAAAVAAAATQRQQEVGRRHPARLLNLFF